MKLARFGYRGLVVAALLCLFFSSILLGSSPSTPAASSHDSSSSTSTSSSSSSSNLPLKKVSSSHVTPTPPAAAPSAPIVFPLNDEDGSDDPEMLEALPNPAEPEPELELEQEEPEVREGPGPAAAAEDPAVDLSGDFDFAEHVLAITEKDSYLIYDYPAVMLLAGYNFTVEMWYRTPAQPEVKDPVAIFGNMRDVEDALKYGRSFEIMLQPTGKVTVEFHSLQMKADGKMESTRELDDNEWHHIAVTRNTLTEMLTLFVDFTFQTQMKMPNGIDVMDQEQRTVIGGGNDRAFRECYIDEFRLWKIARPVGDVLIDDKHACVPCTNPDLVAYFDFEEDNSWPVVVRDCSTYGGHAMRAGALVKRNPYLVPDANRGVVHPAIMSSKCSGSGKVHGKPRPPPETSTILLTSLYWRCGGLGDAMFDTGRIYQFEAYISSLWLDVNRVNAKMLVLYDCLDPEVVQLYSTPNVQFVHVVPYDERVTLKCHPVIQRFLVFHQLMLSKDGVIPEEAEYIAMLDFRDSHMNHSPKPYWDANPETDIVLQGINGMSLVCGGFQAGKRKAILVLLDEMAKGMAEDKCRRNDQDILNDVYGYKRLGSLKVVTDGDMVTPQQVRVFDKATAFEHSLWWNSNINFNRDGYPKGIP